MLTKGFSLLFSLSSIAMSLGKGMLLVADEKSDFIPILQELKIPFNKSPTLTALNELSRALSK
ncbi:MAG: hypothetical protein ACPLSK_04960 [bacterium]